MQIERGLATGHGRHVVLKSGSHHPGKVPVQLAQCRIVGGIDQPLVKHQSHAT